MPKFFGYIRVSTDEQANYGISLEAQRDKLALEYETVWKPLGYTLGQIVVEAGVSGGKAFLSRPGGMKVSVLATRGDVLVFTRLDRAFRNTRDALTAIDVMAQQGIRIVFLDHRHIDTGTPQGYAMLTVFAVFSQLERAMISERTKEALVAFRKKGLPAKPIFCTRWRGPKGKRVLVVHEPEYALGLRILAWRQEGHTLDAVRWHLKKNGIRKKVTEKTARRIGIPLQDRKREITVRMLERMIGSTMRTTQWIASGKVIRDSKVPAGEPYVQPVAQV